MKYDELIRRAARIHETTAEAADIVTCAVTCRTCGKTLPVDGARALARGWPKCHGETMRLNSKLSLPAKEGAGTTEGEIRT